MPFVSYLHFFLDGSFSARLALHSLLLFILGCWFGRKRQRSCCNQTFLPWGFCGGICRGLDWSLHSQEKRKRILRESRFWMLYVLFCTPKQKLLVNIYINCHSNFIYIFLERKNPIAFILICERNNQRSKLLHKIIGYCNRSNLSKLNTNFHSL